MVQNKHFKPTEDQQNIVKEPVAYHCICNTKIFIVQILNKNCLDIFFLFIFSKTTFNTSCIMD